jgi:predicted DNA-binding protein YlxM (UPF0122 family)
MHKLTEKQVNDIVEEYFMDGAAQRDISKQYSVISRYAIWAIVHHKSWKHLPVFSAGGFTL